MQTVTWTDRDIVLACLKQYSVAYSVSSWPEVSSRNNPEVDGYAEASGECSLAIGACQWE